MSKRNMPIGGPVMTKCHVKECENKIKLPLNPMVIAKICKEQGWEERAVIVPEWGNKKYNTVFCPEHK